MSPTPRSRTRLSSVGSSSGSNGRLNLLIILVVVQIILLVVVVLNQQTETDDNQAVAEMRQMLIEIEQTAARLDAISDQQAVTARAAVIPKDATIRSRSDENERDDAIIAIKVQVLNGCGVAGIAGKAGKWLKRNGYVVKDIGNADRQDHKLTSIVDRSGNLTAARELASLLGISEDRITRQGSGPKPKVDLTLILGKDCKRLPIGR